MRRGEFILVWVVCFLVLLVGSLLSPNDSGTWPSVYIVVNEGVAEVVPSAEFYSRFRTGGVTGPNVYLRYGPDRDPGPLKGLVEFWVVESAFASRECLTPGKTKLRDDQVDLAYGALIEYAKADPAMARYRPGESPRRVYSWGVFGKTVLRLIALFGIPTIIALIGKFIMDREIAIRHGKRRKAGLCVYCLYPCAQISSLRCPECGSYHTVPYAGVEPLDERDA